MGVVQTYSSDGQKGRVVEGEIRYPDKKLRYVEWGTSALRRAEIELADGGGTITTYVRICGLGK